MNETEAAPLAQRLLQRYQRKKELVGYPYFDWSGRIIAFFAYLSLVASGGSILKCFRLQLVI